MGVYVIAQISITDPEAYKRYQDRFMDVFGRFEGKLLAADAGPQVVEGVWEREKVILLSFPNENAFRDWAFSPDYREISKDREAGSNGVVLLVKGIS
ncbi:MAG: DUF1330 domain-containing protein [Pyrinomonadaceae bacterium]